MQGSRARGEARTTREALVWDSGPPPPQSYPRVESQGASHRRAEPPFSGDPAGRLHFSPRGPLFHWVLLVPEILPHPAFSRLKYLASPLGIQVPEYLVCCPHPWPSSR